MGARKSNFRPAKQHATLTSGEVIRLLHELKGGDAGGTGKKLLDQCEEHQPA
jgi:hypothetical protein